jgi:lipopolysaccharide/colanic/teichoic acid biosynthesis glycosyltransferase
VSSILIKEVTATDAAAAPLERGLIARGFKRSFDLVVALIALVLFAPLFLLIIVAIKLDSSGPIFFRQVRVGRHGRRFLMWKFRKMYNDLPLQGPNLTKRYDFRMTRVGRFLERTKLDELPQLFNVLSGEMSIVGPRPEVPPFVEHYPDQWARVLAVKPGIVGPCQVRFRNESELYPEGCTDVEGYYLRQILPAKLVIDAEYASRVSILSDVFIMVRAILMAFGGAVTLQTVLNRRWQVLNTVFLSLAGIVGTLLAIRLQSRPLDPNAAWWILLFAAISKPLCIMAFKIPRALATSITADDLLRCCWCAAVSESLLGCCMLFAGFRSLGRGVLLADAILFLAILVLCKLICYSVYLCYFQRRGSGLWGRLIFAALLCGPLSMASVITVRQGTSAWTDPERSSVLILLVLALAIRPAVILFKPVSSRRSVATWLKKDWGTLLFGSVVGSSLIVSGAVLLNVRGISRLGMACDGAVYLFLMTAFALWSEERTNRCRRAHLVPRRREKLLLLGDAIQLTAFMAAFTAMRERRLEIVGALSLRRGFRDKMAGGVSVLGTIDDAPDVVQMMRVSRVVVIDAEMTDAAIESLQKACGLDREQVMRVDFLRPVLQLWRADSPTPPLGEQPRKWAPEGALGPAVRAL